jgi:hypothetical protein
MWSSPDEFSRPGTEITGDAECLRVMRQDPDGMIEVNWMDSGRRSDR